MSCSKIFSGDLPELTYEIIKYFQNDFSTLHSCILVNRLWCRLAIPLLWENPFSTFTENHNFIEIYLHNNLNDDLKTKLNEYNIIYNSLSSNTLFNYPSFLKYLNTREIISSIESWAEVAVVETLKLNGDLHSVFNFKKLIHLSLFKTFIENEVNLHTFEIEIMNCDYNYSKDVLELILQNTNFIYNIKNLNLYIGNLTISEYHYNSNERMLIKNCILQIINLHQNLEKISFYSTYYPLYQSLLLSSKDHDYSNTLKTILLYHVNFDGIVNLNETFEQLNVLESVHIIYCYSLDASFVQQIVSLTRPFKLKSLFVSEIPQIQLLRLLLQKSGCYLKNFGFRNTVFNPTLLLQQQLFKLITEYCKNVKFLEFFGLEGQIVYSLFNLIESNKQNLNYLSISVRDHRLMNDNIECSSIILKNLGQILPFKLEYLNLVLVIEESDFEVFLEDSKNIFINKLLIKQKGGSDGILHYIKKFIMKEQRVKYLGIMNFKKEDLSNLKDEVKEFKLHNIRVRNFDDLYLSCYSHNFIKNVDYL
ncbi:hypothetical protein RclHR1_09980005 [Rhizophagus clarus]|uniref:F-box domain-containing protein n=1 Tax=Rhizophagus clarus TaxID=94130 RepID=A0A2Z6S848_9GLOM|nr:hypothetical protein RclHR1_09980005 [Rhizophagus clarus]GES72749.1 hypothetical protein GLOIN_2v1877795 [Rhizophagus clarus]